MAERTLRRKLSYMPLEDGKQGRFLFWVCFIAYTLIYTGRLNWSAAMADMISGGLYDNTQCGIVSTAFFITYGSFQLLSGFIGDRISPFKLVAFGITGAGVMNLIMSYVLDIKASFVIIVVVWSVNGIVQSTIWSPMIRIISSVLPLYQRSDACANILMSTAAGQLFSYLLSTITVKFLGYSGAFLVPGIIVVVTGILWCVTMFPIDRQTRCYSESVKKADDKKSGGTSLFPLLFSSGFITLLAPTAFLSLMKDGITTWTPTIITSNFDVDSSFAIILTCIIPVALLVGGMLTKIVLRYIHNTMIVCAMSCGIAALLEFVVMLTIKTNAVVMVFVMGITAAVTMISTNIFNTYVPVEFASYGCVSTVTGIMNAWLNIFTSLSSLIIGLVTDAHGWIPMFYLWIAFGVIASVTALISSRPWGKFCDSHR